MVKLAKPIGLCSKVVYAQVSGEFTSAPKPLLNQPGHVGRPANQTAFQHRKSNSSHCLNNDTWLWHD